MIMMRKQFLFVDWEGGGNLPPALAIARCLIERGHTVRFLGEPCNREEIEATGSAFVSYVHAPHRDNKRPESDFIRDWEAHTPFEAFARTRERLMFGPASAYAQDVLEELAAHPADAVAADFPLFGPLVGMFRPLYSIPPSIGSQPQDCLRPVSVCCRTLVHGAACAMPCSMRSSPTCLRRDCLT